MTRRKLRLLTRRFLNIKSLRDLAVVLDVPMHGLTLQSAYIEYDSFSIPKPSGGYRHIENPYPGLKSIQRKLNRYLQGIYWLHKTHAAYGFIIDVKKSADRNIYTNAARHLNRDYLLNMDFKDFFHSISENSVTKMLKSFPFHFSTEVSSTITQLVTYKGRLPMGAPTSPVLTNLYCIGLDRDIKAHCDMYNICYTRYADDMSFSSRERILVSSKDRIESIGQKYHLSINHNKTKWYGPTDIKKVTGLIVSDRIDIPPVLIEDTRKEIAKLKNIIEVNRRYYNQKNRWIMHHQQKIRGYIQFVRQAKGTNDPIVQELMTAYEEALYPTSNQDPKSWLDLPYLLF